MRKFFNGGYGLAITYWIGVAGAGVIAKIVFLFINKGYLTTVDDTKFARLELFHNCFLVALSIYMLLMSRAMFRAGFDGRRPGAWGWIGIAVTLLRTLYILYVTMTVLFPATATPKFILELEIRQLNKQLPQDMGDGFAMTQVDINNDELIYSFRVTADLDEIWKEEFQIPLMSTVEGQVACQDLQSYFRGGINTVITKYTFENDTVEQTIDGAECLEWLATR